MLLCKLNELVYIGFNSFYSTLHGRYSITLSLQSDTLPPNSPEFLICQPRCTTSMYARKIATEDENFIRLERDDMIGCYSHNR